MKRKLLIQMPKVTAYDGPPMDTVSGGEYVTCSNGHKHATITRGFDPKQQDYYVEARCHARDCPGIQRVYDLDRKERRTR